jgi:hypothetical protein
MFQFGAITGRGVARTAEPWLLAHDHILFLEEEGTPATINYRHSNAALHLHRSDRHAAGGNLGLH